MKIIAYFPLFVGLPIYILFGVLGLLIGDAFEPYQRWELIAVTYTILYGIVYTLFITQSDLYVNLSKGKRSFISIFSWATLIPLGLSAFFAYLEILIWLRPLLLSLGCFIYFLAGKYLSTLNIEETQNKLSQIKEYKEKLNDIMDEIKEEKVSAKIAAWCVDLPCSISFAILFLTIMIGIKEPEFFTNILKKLIEIPAINATNIMDNISISSQYCVYYFLAGSVAFQLSIANVAYSIIYLKKWEKFNQKEKENKKDDEK